MFKHIKLFIVISLFTCLNLLSQAPDTAWTRVLGGPLDDRGNCVRQTDDGGYIIAGRTRSFGAGNMDIQIAIYNPMGERVKKLFSGSRPAGVPNLTWGGRDNTGEKLPGGIYFLKIATPEETGSKKLILIR